MGKGAHSRVPLRVLVLGALALLILLPYPSFSQTATSVTASFSAGMVLSAIQRGIQVSKPVLLRSGVQGLAIYLALDVISQGFSESQVSQCYLPAQQGITNATTDFGALMTSTCSVDTAVVCPSASSVTIPAGQNIYGLAYDIYPLVQPCNVISFFSYRSFTGCDGGL